MQETPASVLSDAKYWIEYDPKVECRDGGWSLLWCFFRGTGLAIEAEFSRGSLGAELTGEMEDGTGTGGGGRVILKAGEGEQAGGFGKSEPGTKLARGGADDAAAQRGIEGAETGNIQGERSLAGVR